MSLSPWEEQALESIGGQLTETDPKLATLLDTFSRLTAGEHMPARETVFRRSRRPARRAHCAGWHVRKGFVARHARRSLRRAGYGQVMLLLWLAISVTLIAVAVTLTRGGSRPGCGVDLPLACASSVPSHSSSPGTHGAPVGHISPG